MQRLQRLRILEQQGTIDSFQSITTLGQKLVEVTDGLLVGTHVCSAHLGKSSIHTFEGIQVLSQPDLGRSEFRTFISRRTMRFSLPCNSPGSNDPLFLSFVLSWLKHLVNVLDEPLDVWNTALGATIPL